MTPVITATEIIACHPCANWPHDHIRALVGNGMTPSALARHAGVSLADRRWALTQVLARRDRRALVRWACDCASGVIDRLDGEVRSAAEACISTTLAWCDGGASKAVVEARGWLFGLHWPAADAAHAAAADAAAYAAYAAADDAAAYAAYAAADAAAYAADAHQDALDALAAYYEVAP